MMRLYAIRPPRPSTRCPAGLDRPPVAAGVVRAVEVVLVGQQAVVLDEEARLAHELTGTLGKVATTGLGSAVVRLGSLFLLVVLLFLGIGDAVLQDGVEVGLDVVGVGLLVLLVGFLVVVALGLDRSDRLLFVFIFFFVGLCVVVGEVLVDEVVGFVDVFVEVEVLVDLLDVLLGLLELFVRSEEHTSELQSLMRISYA